MEQVNIVVIRKFGGQNLSWIRGNQPTKFYPFNGYNEELLLNHRKFQDKINGGLIAKWLKYTWVHRLWKKSRRYWHSIVWGIVIAYG